jgi:hypothetical protein
MGQVDDEARLVNAEYSIEITRPTAVGELSFGSKLPISAISCARRVTLALPQPIHAFTKADSFVRGVPGELVVDHNSGYAEQDDHGGDRRHDDGQQAGGHDPAWGGYEWIGHDHDCRHGGKVQSDNR